MGRTWDDGGYSADLRVYLICDGKRYEVAELGPESMILRSHDGLPLSHAQLPLGHAQLVVEIDGDREVQDVIVSCLDRELAEIAFA